MLPMSPVERAPRIEEVYHALQPVFVAGLSSDGLPLDVAEDIVQEVFADIVARNAWPAIRNHRSYLANAVRRSALRYWRDSERRERLVRKIRALTACPVLRAPDVLEQQRIRYEISDIMNRLPGQQRAVCTLLMEGYSVGEISVRLDLAGSTVRRHRQLARKSLRTHLEDYPILRSFLEGNSMPPPASVTRD